MDVNMSDSDGRTGLMASCEAGRADCVQLLLDAADLSKRRSGCSALHRAVTEGHATCLELCSIRAAIRVIRTTMERHCSWLASMATTLRLDLAGSRKPTS